MTQLAGNATPIVEEQPLALLQPLNQAAQMLSELTDLLGRITHDLHNAADAVLGAAPPEPPETKSPPMVDHSLVRDNGGALARLVDQVDKALGQAKSLHQTSRRFTE